jgi:hypothetical protein
MRKRVSDYSLGQFGRVRLFLKSKSLPLRRQREIVGRSPTDGTRDAKARLDQNACLHVNLRHQIVNFRLQDIFFPDPAEVVLELHGGQQIEGEVIDLSDSGAQKEAFAVIRVERMSQPVLVPVTCLKILPAT